MVTSKDIARLSGRGVAAVSHGHPVVSAETRRKGLMRCDSIVTGQYSLPRLATVRQNARQPAERGWMFCFEASPATARPS